MIKQLTPFIKYTAVFTVIIIEMHKNLTVVNYQPCCVEHTIHTFIWAESIPLLGCGHIYQTRNIRTESASLTRPKCRSRALLESNTVRNTQEFCTKQMGLTWGVSKLSQNLIRLLCSQSDPPERPGNHLTTTTSADIITILLAPPNYYNTQRACKIVISSI